MSLNFTCAVVTGSAGGLGKCFAQSLISKGKKVILAGRTESSLKQTASEIGAAAYYVIDVSKTGSLTGAVETILKEHPDVDCLFNNAGVQKPLNFASENITDKLGDIDEEINTNITGLVHLCALFVPHFLKNDKPAAIFNVTSGLAYIPISPVPVYCATKSFVKSFTLSLREQLKNTKVKVYEVAPPLVESNLHRDHDNWDNKKAPTAAALTQEEFMKGVEEGFEKGDLDIAVGFAKFGLGKWNEAFGETHKKMNSQ